MEDEANEIWEYSMPVTFFLRLRCTISVNVAIKDVITMNLQDLGRSVGRFLATYPNFFEGIL